MPGTYSDKLINPAPVWYITKGATVYSALQGSELYESVSEELETDYTFETVDLSMWPDFL